MPPYLTKVAIDRHIAQGDAAGLPALAALYLVTLVLAFAVRFAQVYILQLTGQRVMLEMRRRIFGHLQRLHVGFFDRHPVGRLMTRVTSDVDAVNELFTSGVVTVFGDLFTLLGIMAVMLWMDWRLALTAFAVIPGLFLVTNWFRRGSRRTFREVRRWVARINAYLQEHLVGMGVVQLFRREERARGRLLGRQPRPHRGQHPPDLLLRGVLSGHRHPGRGGRVPHPSLWRRAGAAGRADPGRPGGLHPVQRALLAAHLRPLGEVQHPAVGHGLLGAHLHAARHARRGAAPLEPAPVAALRGPRGLRGRLVPLQRGADDGDDDPAGSCATSPSRCGRASRWPWWAPPARARPASSACWPASTTRSGGG